MGWLVPHIDREAEEALAAASPEEPLHDQTPNSRFVLGLLSGVVFHIVVWGSLATFLVTKLS
jgi:hypothetical protein